MKLFMTFILEGIADGEIKVQVACGMSMAVKYVRG